MIWEEEAHGGFPDPAMVFGLAGVEQLRAFFIAGGPRPPISHLTGMDFTEVGVGSASFTMPVSDWLLPPQGLIAAGALAMLADGSLGCAVQTGLPPATMYTTSELSLNMLRPVAPTAQTLIARGRIVHGGKSLALSEVFVEDDRGRLICHGSSRCFIFPPMTPAPPAPEEIPTWEEPVYETADPWLRPLEGEVLGADVWETMSGLEIASALIAGELPAPPLYHLTGMRLTAAAEGTATFVLPASAWLCPPHGMVQGGAIAMVADSALAVAVQTTVPAGKGYAPMDLKVYFTRPVYPDGRNLTATAIVVNRGRNIAIANAEVFDANGKKVAQATASSLITDRPVTAARPVSPSDQALAPGMPSPAG